jgi:hypothetical protein
VNSGVKLPPYDHPSVWRASWKLKKDIYGKKHIILASSKLDISGASGPMQKRNDTTIEPVCWHPMPLELYDDLIQGFYVKLVYDLVCVDGMVAWASLCRRVGYVGIVFTEKGADAIYDRIFQLMVVHMAEVGHVRYDPQFAAAIGCSPPNPKSEPKAKAAAKGELKAKAAAKKNEKKKTGKKDGDKKGGKKGEEDVESDLISGDSNLIGMLQCQIAFVN